MKLEYFGVQTPIIKHDSNLLDIFLVSVSNHPELQIQSGDIIIIASKVVAMVQNRLINLDSIKPSEKAKELAKKSNLPATFVQIVLDESEEVIGAVKGALLTIRKGDVQANAGIDKSNAGNNMAILLPEDSDGFALSFKNQIEEKLNLKDIGVLVVDSCTRPLRRGTLGMALGTSGIPAIVDDRGLLDLFGFKMEITFRAIADNLASGANILMGESSESTPFVVVKGISELIKKNNWLDRKVENMRVPPKECLFLGNLSYKNILDD